MEAQNLIMLDMKSVKNNADLLQKVVECFKAKHAAESIVSIEKNHSFHGHLEKHILIDK